MFEFFYSSALKFIFAVAGFGILVFIHELGHFIAGKISGVVVEVFSIGMGPKIFEFFYKGTYYRLSRIPIGGYCKFKNDEIGESFPNLINKREFQLIKKIRSVKTDIQANFEEFLPYEIDKATFEKIKQLNAVTANSIESLYKYDNSWDSYKISDSTMSQSSDQFMTVINDIKTINDDLISYRLKLNLENKKGVIDKVKKEIPIYKLRSPEGFYGQNPFKRIFIVFAGPLMNFILALILFASIGMIPYSEPFFSTRVNLVDDLYSTAGIPLEKIGKAKSSGVISGDIIKAINGQKVESFLDIQKIVAINGEKELELSILRGDSELIINLIPDWDPQSMRPLVGITTHTEPVIRGNDNRLAQFLDLSDHDRIIEIDNINTGITAELINMIFRTNFSKNKTSILKILKFDGSIKQITINYNEINDEISEDLFYLDFIIEYRDVGPLSPLESFVSGLGELKDAVELMFNGLYALVFKPKKDVMSQMGGVLRIGSMIGEATYGGLKEGVLSGIRLFLSVLGYLSISLCVFNLLPIPAIDGGHIILYLLEIIFRREINMKVVYYINIGGFIILFSFMIFVTFFDILYLFDLLKSQIFYYFR